MPTEKKKPSKKIIDVSHPDATPADANSKSVIVKNRALAGDPMMITTTGGETVTDTSAEDTQQDVSKKKITIQPLHIDLPADKDGERANPTEAVGAPSLPIETAAKPADTAAEKPTESESKPEDSNEATEHTTITVRTSRANAEKKIEPLHDMATATPPQPSPATVSETADVGKAVPASPVDTEPDATTPSEKNDARPKPDAPDVSNASVAPGAAPATDEPNDDAFGDDGKTSPAAAQEARELAEKQLAIQKLVDNRVYNLPINTVQKSRNRRTLVVTVLLVVLLSLVGFLAALDAGIIELPIAAPTDFLADQ